MSGEKSMAARKICNSLVAGERCGKSRSVGSWGSGWVLEEDLSTSGHWVPPPRSRFAEQVDSQPISEANQSRTLRG